MFPLPLHIRTCREIFVWCFSAASETDSVLVSDQSIIPIFGPKKLISQPLEVQNPPNLTQGTLTQYILRLVIGGGGGVLKRPPQIIFSKTFVFRVSNGPYLSTLH